ncbi:zinc ribbon domain-containing protein [Streptomyces rimosus]|uniref:NADase-type glycan-binding domain-containing protein n=1 Tax=Streptomyces rimosus TaxID=1927 RepID=UPI0031CEF1F9
MTTPDCGECGTRAEPGQSFCDACGAVLRWDAAGARAGAGAPAASSNAGSGRGVSARADGDGAARRPYGPQGAEPARGTGTDAHGSGPAPGPDTSAISSAPSGHRASGTDSERPGNRDAAATSGAPRAASSTPDLEDTDPRMHLPTRQDGLPADSSTTTDRARSLLVPVPEQEAAPAVTAPAVAPVLPGRPDTERPHVRVPGPQGTGHGPPCSWCSTPNHPDRHFCNHCAMPLAESDTPTPGRRPWWRRLLGADGQEAPWAGDRPRLRRAFDRIGTWITLAVAVTLVVLGVVYLPDGIDATRDHFAKRAPVEPDEIRASRSYPGHGPKLAFDKLSNTWWGPGVSQSGQGEWVEVRFARPARLLDVIITPGVSARADQLDKSALPHRVKATVTGKDGRTTTRELTLDPGAGGQRRAFRVGEATAVRFTIESAHAASAEKQVAIAEIELFGRSGADQS